MSTNEKRSVHQLPENTQFDFSKLINEFIKGRENDHDKREQEILADKLEIYFEGRELVWEDLNYFFK